jgi:hypothetical protein
MVKVHLFSGYESEKLKITRDTPLGHLYSDQNTEELLEAARLIGVSLEYLQNSRGFEHFDLWGKPLKKARLLFVAVDNHRIYRDMKKLAAGGEVNR